MATDGVFHFITCHIGAMRGQQGVVSKYTVCTIIRQVVFLRINFVIVQPEHLSSKSEVLALREYLLCKYY